MNSTCSWCHGGIIACPTRFGYRTFCSERHRDAYLAWVGQAQPVTDMPQEDFMSSRYDRRDPGQDPAYCDGLEPDEDSVPENWDICIWCGEPYELFELESHHPYCSSLCAIRASMDGEGA